MESRTKPENCLVLEDVQECLLMDRVDCCVFVMYHELHFMVVVVNVNSDSGISIRWKGVELCIRLFDGLVMRLRMI